MFNRARPTWSRPKLGAAGSPLINHSIRSQGAFANRYDGRTQTCAGDGTTVLLETTGLLEF